MLTYAVVAGRDGRPVPAATLEALRDRHRETSFRASDHHCWTSPSGSVAVGAWISGVDDPIMRGRWRAGADGVTGFSGTPWHREAPWDTERPWVDQLAAVFARDPLERGTDALLGVFTALSLDGTGRGAVASDPLGIGLLYIGRDDEVTVVGPRPHVVAEVLAAAGGTAPARDPLGVCWMAYASHPMSSSTGYVGVEVVPLRSIVRVDPGRGAEVVPLGGEHWLERVESEADRRRLVEGLRADVATVLHGVAALPVDRQMGLTGGRDSRVVLAVLLEEGLADEFEFRTLGSPDLPDMVIARDIAKRFGLRQALNPTDPEDVRHREQRAAALREAGHGDLSYREAAMRTTVGGWQGMRNVAEPKPARPARGDAVLISGICGEMLRSNYRPAKRFTTASESARFPFVGMKCGHAGILRPEALEHYDRTIATELLEGFDEADQARDVIDAFYMRQRMRRWFGGGLELDAPNRVFPLHSDTGMRAAFAIGPDARHAEWLPFELIRSSCPPLVDVPLDNGEWDPVLTEIAAGTIPARPPAAPRRGPAPLPDPLVPPEARPAGGPGPPTRPLLVRTVQRERRAKLAAVDVEIMRRHLLEAPSNPVFDVLDHAGVARAIDRFTELPDTAKFQLYGALTAAIWLGGDELPPVLDLPDGPTG